MKSQVRGGTRWKRFAVVMVPSVAATAAIGVGLAQGALAASFSISGQEFKVKAKSLVGKDFVQYGSVNVGKDLEGKNFAAPVAVSGFSEAWITDMCQSVVTPKVPFINDSITLRLTAGTGKDKVYAKDIYLDVSSLKTNAEFKNIDIGVAAGKLNEFGGKVDESKPGIQPGTQANPFGFGQRAKDAVLNDVEQKAWATTAATFKLPNLDLSLHKGTSEECFKD
ncbi:DUF6230 family protein [Streptomyces sp. SBC-4]|nr:DUF6230 family protein [Streptomyces sp. SBC-4]MDV5148440.1 DUF6230 family protein [Streptomyces sp. SBC-4]